MWVCLLFLTGCGKTSESDLINKWNKKVEDSKGYLMTGQLEIVNNDDVYNYNVSSAYKDGDYYRISLTNTANNHEQIILKNDDGIFVLTPSLRKSFKFQSDWPYNNSQIYLLQSIISDLKNDSKKEMVQEDKNYIFTHTVNYPNNRNLIKQEVTLTEDMELKKVVVLTDNDVPKMTLTVKDIDYSPNFSNDYFDLDEIMSTSENNTDQNTTEEEQNTEENSDTTKESEDSTTTEEGTTEESSSIDDIIYPLVLPEGTTLKSEEKVSKTDGERVILTFEGDKPFLLVEETVTKEDEWTIIPTAGEPYLFMDTIGALTDNSLTWTSGGMEYYIVSDVMNQEELVEVAGSINVIPTMNVK